MNQFNQLWRKYWSTPAAAPPGEIETCTCTTIPPCNTKSITFQPSSPLLRLPAELRLQIYGYLHLSGHVFEVISKPDCRMHISQQRLWYCFESPTDAEGTQKLRHGHVFPIMGVCRHLRNETEGMVYEGNAFAFSDKTYNYATAFPIFTSSLSSHQLSLIKTIYWPLRQARDFQRFHHSMQLPDRTCADDFAKLTGLKKVVLRYVATDVGSARLAEHEQEEFEGLGDTGYAEERRFRRELAVRAMRGLLGREGVEVVCEMT